MTHEYTITGMTCGGCVATVQQALAQAPGIRAAEVTLDPPAARLEMERHVGLDELKAALADYPQYQISAREAEKTDSPAPNMEAAEEARSFWQTYKPILLVFTYILGATLLAEFAAGAFDWMRWMRHFMAGFFLVFSFFKLLDVPAFAVSYSSYDLLARRWLGWGYVYPFVELALGVLYLINFSPIFTNAATLAVMGFSTIGVAQSLLAKRRFRCACLGAVFNLPMSTITLAEDLLMVGMAGGMLLGMLL
jgi:copper chaperone CopZ